MARVECGFCGLPFTVRAPKEGATYYCCSGCALASRIPMNGDNLPVSRGLIVALAFGFGLFNEVLFGVLGGAVLAEGRADVGLLALRISLIIGALLLVGGCVLMLTARSRGWTDGAVAAIALIIAGGGAWLFLAEGTVGGVWGVTTANAVIAGWLSRGWVRRSLGRKRSG